MSYSPVVSRLQFLFAKLTPAYFWIINLALVIAIGFFEFTVLQESPEMRASGIVRAKIFITEAIVLLGIISGIRLTFQRRTQSLGRLLFLVEFPLLFISFWFLTLPAYPWSFMLVGLSILIAALNFYLHLNNFTFPYHDKLLYWSKHFGLAIAAWIFLVWIFFIPGMVWAFLKGLIENFEYMLDDMNPTISGLAMFIVGSTFFFSPLIALLTFGSEFINLSNLRKWRHFFITSTALLLFMIIMNFFEKIAPQQSLQRAELLLRTQPFTQELSQQIGNSQLLQSHLKQIYFARYKYPLEDFVPTRSGSTGVRSLGSNIDRLFAQLYCNTKSPTCGQVLGSIYRPIIFPIYYPGSFYDDQQTAAKIYEQLFDASLAEETRDQLYAYTRRSLMGQGFRNPDTFSPHQNVLLRNVETQTSVNQDLGLYIQATTYTFQNSTDQQQEAVLEFNLPSTTAVVTDLHLGPGLELPSQVAPRGAALAVYQQSLRRNIDPALLEQVGPRTYRLRVFPIPQATDKSSPGTQKVQIEFTADLHTHPQIPEVMPITPIRNLKLNNQTLITSTIRNRDIELKTQTFPHQQLVNVQPPIYTLEYFQTPTLSFETTPSNFVNLQSQPAPQPHQLAIYFDNSYSANHNQVHKQYQQILSYFQDQNITVIPYTFNFQIQRLESLDDLEFWGYTDTTALTQHLADTSDTYNLIITDDSTFEHKRDAQAVINLSSFSNRQLMLIQLSDHPISLKTDLTNAILASQGHTHQIADSSQLTLVLADVFTKPQINFLHGNATGARPFEPQWEEAFEDLWAAYQSRELLSQIRDEPSSQQVMTAQTAIAARAHIINSFNSLIALETDAQQRQLERLSQQDNKYRRDHQSAEEIAVGDLPNFQRTPEPDVYITLAIVLSILGIYHITFKKVFFSFDEKKQ